MQVMCVGGLCVFSKLATCVSCSLQHGRAQQWAGVYMSCSYFSQVIDVFFSWSVLCATCRCARYWDLAAAFLVGGVISSF